MKFSVFAGLAIFFGIEYFKLKDDTSEQGNVKTENTVIMVEQSDEKTVVDIPNMTNDYMKVKSMMKKLVSGLDKNMMDIVSGSGLTYKPEGFNTYIPMRFDLRINMGSSIDLVGLQSKLEDAGFVSIGNLPHLGSAGPQVIGYLNPDGIVCGAYSNLDASSTNTLECAKTDWAWLTDEERSLIKELEEAYYNKTGQYPLTVYGFEAEPKDSSVTPYQTLSVAIGGGGGLFYRTSPEAKWQFFTGGQAAPGCDAYDTDDLKKAFADTICYDTLTGSNSTVQP